MGLISQILGDQQTVQLIVEGGAIIALDASIKEVHTRESPPTEWEVEDGSTVSDHILVKPFSLEIEGIISDAPIGGIFKSALTTAAGAFLPPVGIVAAGLGVGLVGSIFGGDSPSIANYLNLLKAQQNRSKLTVTTSLNSYSNMYIKSLSVPRDANTGRALIFTISLVQLILVKPDVIDISIFSNADLSAADVNAGTQQMGNSKIGKQFTAGVGGGKFWGNTPITGVPQAP